MPIPHPLAATMLSPLWRLRMASFPAPELDHIRYVCMVDDARARETLGYAPKKTFAETVCAVDEGRWKRNMRLWGLVFGLAIGVIGVGGLAACSGARHRTPAGPPPEYEPATNLPAVPPASASAGGPAASPAPSPPSAKTPNEPRPGSSVDGGTRSSSDAGASSRAGVQPRCELRVSRHE